MLKNSFIYPVLVVGLMLAATFTSFFWLQGQSLRLDESQSLWQTSHSPGALLSIVAQDVHVPLHHLLLHFWQLFFGNLVQTSRLLSLIFFVLTIPTVYITGRDAFGRNTGLFAAALIAVSPFLNWYGSEIRMYSLLTLLTAFSQLLFLRLLRGAKNRVWMLYGLVCILGVFTHYFFFLVLVTQLLFFIVYRQEFPKGANWKIFWVAAVIILAFVPWLLYAYHLGFASSTQPLLDKPTTINLFGTYAEFIVGFQDDHLNTIFVSLWPLIVLLGFFSLQQGRKIPLQTRYFLLAGFLPILLVFAVSIALKPIYVSRYLIVAVPGLYLFLAWLIDSYPRSYSIPIKATIVALMIAGLAVQAGSAQTPVKENYEQASNYLQQHASDQDIIILSAPFTVYPVEYYYQGSATIQTLPIWNRFQSGPVPPFIPSKLASQVDSLASNHRIAWVLLSYDQGYQKDIKSYFETHYQQLSSQLLSPGLTLYAYRLRYDPQLSL